MMSQKSEEEQYNIASYILSMGVGSIVYLSTHYSIKSHFSIISNHSSIPFYLLCLYGLILSISGFFKPDANNPDMKSWFILHERLWIICGGAFATFLILCAI